MGVDFLAVYESALNRYEQAFENIELRKSILAYESRAISDVIPGFEAESSNSARLPKRTTLSCLWICASRQNGRTM